MEILKLISILLTHTFFCVILYAVACNILTSFIHNFTDVKDLKTIFMSFCVHSRNISYSLKKVVGIRNKSENQWIWIYLLHYYTFTLRNKQVHLLPSTNFDNYAMYSLSRHHYWSTSYLTSSKQYIYIFKLSI